MPDNSDAYHKTVALLEALDAKIFATPPPTGTDRQTMCASYDQYRVALDDIAMTDYISAADEVTEAAKAIVDVPNLGIVQALSQQVLLALGVSHMLGNGAAPNIAPAAAGAAVKAPAPPVAVPQPQAAAAVAGQGQMNDAGFALLRKWEGFVPYAYDDANDGKILPGDVVRGKLTIAYGHTGNDVRAGQTCTQAEANQWLQGDVGRAASNVVQLVKTKLNDNQFSALVCFVFNEGPGTFAKSSVLDYVDDPNLAGVPARLALYNKVRVDGQFVTSQGLTRRRAAEIALWQTPPP